jgi:hypothetical protein
MAQNAHRPQLTVGLADFVGFASPSEVNRRFSEDSLMELAGEWEGRGD